MSIISKLKSELDFAIFRATPSDWIDPNNPLHHKALFFSCVFVILQQNQGFTGFEKV